MLYDNARRTGCCRGPGSCTLSRGVLVGEGVDLGVTECPQLGLGAGALTVDPLSNLLSLCLIIFSPFCILTSAKRGL